MEQGKIGQRTTKQRDLIFEIVRGLKTHPTAEDVYVLAKRSIENISLATVYRNLRLLASEGAVREVQFEDGIMRFDGMTEEHEHFVCTGCHGIQDIAPTRVMQSAHTANPELQSMTVSGYHLSYYGLCAECTKHRNERK